MPPHYLESERKILNNTFVNFKMKIGKYGPTHHTTSGYENRLMYREQCQRWRFVRDNISTKMYLA